MDMDKKVLRLPGFPDSLLPRIDRLGVRLEEANPGVTFDRTTCIVTLLVRALADMEGQEVWERRKGGDGEKRRSAGERRWHPRRWLDRAVQHVAKEVAEILKLAR